MPYIRPEALVATEWLADRLGDPEIALIDASWHMPATKRDAFAEFKDAHVPGARFFDIDRIADRSVNLPHMVPDERIFGDEVGKLGISNRHHVIVYDVSGGAGAGMRAWWMFRLFGHARVSLLAGGLAKWKAEGRPVRSSEALPARTQFLARLEPRLLRTLEQVRANVGAQAEQLIDVRSAGRFSGAELEPRQGLRGGHIPGSRNLPFSALLDSTNHNVPRPAEELADTIKAAGIDPARPIVASCGSGVTACVLAFSLHLLGREAAVYDGSWTEWGGRADTPVETGP